jgi:hypothetical protein
MRKLLTIIITLVVLKHITAQTPHSIKEQYDYLHSKNSLPSYKYDNQMNSATTVELNTVKNTEDKQDTTNIKPKIAKNTFYVEALGNAPWGTINYDRLFILGQHRFSFRIGCFYYSDKSLSSINSTVYAIPIEINYIKTNRLEFGIGLTYYNMPNDSRTLLLAFRLLSYRYQKPSGGMFYRSGLGISYKIIDFNTAAKLEGNFMPIIGIGIGYTFKNKKL